MKCFAEVVGFDANMMAVSPKSKDCIAVQIRVGRSDGRVKTMDVKKLHDADPAAMSKLLAIIHESLEAQEEIGERQAQQAMRRALGIKP